jgi:hypothetical protein
MAGIPDRLSAAAIAYLAAPALVFCVGWLELAPGILLAALLLSALFTLIRSLPVAEAKPKTTSALIWLLLLALAWSALGGAGHLVYANLDWRTRDAVYADMIFGAWPPAYGADSDVALVLRSATGFFLVPALIAKLTDIVLAPSLLLVWCSLGVALFLLMLPLPRRLGPRLVLLTFLVILFSGMDYPAALLVHGQTPIFPFPLEWWRPWTYTSLSGQLFWAPNHALPLWLGMLLLFRNRDNDSLPALALVVLPLLLLWTPFAAGLVPWYFLAIWKRFGKLSAALHTTSALQWLAALPFLALMIAYLSRPGVGAAPILIGPVDASSHAGAATWSTLDTLVAYMQFAAFEFGLLAMLLRPRLDEQRQAFAVAITLLLLLPLIHIGPSNDWMLRISTPCLVVLLILVLAEFDSSATGPGGSLRRASLIVALGLGAITPGFEIARALIWNRTPPNYDQTLVEQQKGYLPPHYIGRLDQPVLQSLFRHPAPVPSGPQRRAMLP